MLGPCTQRQRYATACCAYRPTFIRCLSINPPPPPPPPLALSLCAISLCPSSSHSSHPCHHGTHGELRTVVVSTFVRSKPRRGVGWNCMSGTEFGKSLHRMDPPSPFASVHSIWERGLAPLLCSPSPLMILMPQLGCLLRSESGAARARCAVRTGCIHRHSSRHGDAARFFLFPANARHFPLDSPPSRCPASSPVLWGFQAHHPRSRHCTPPWLSKCWFRTLSLRYRICLPSLPACMHVRMRTCVHVLNVHAHAKSSKG